MHSVALLLFFFFAGGLCNEYCNLHDQHVLCVKPTVGDACQQFGEVVPNSQQQKEIVDWHNGVRQKVATGLETRGNGGPQPSASNMMKMQWDPELAKIAQRSANQCVFAHDCNKCRRVIGGRFGVGQNIAVSMSSAPFSSFNFPNTIKGWVEKEASLMKPSYVDSYEFGNWGHYSQVVWWNTRSVGCGASSYKEGGWYKLLVFCNYGTAGNMPGAKVYVTGQACSQCPEDTTCDSTFNGLCAIPNSHEVTDKFTPTDQKFLGFPPGYIFPVKK